MGENNGFDEVFVSVMGRLYRRMVAVTGSKTDAEDLVQEVYVRLSGVRQRKRFLEHPSPYAYAFVTAMNLFRTWWKRDRRTELVEHVEPVGAECHLPDIDARVGIVQALRSLTVKEASVVILVDLDGHSLSEAADILRVRKGTVQHNRQRGLEKLRAHSSVAMASGVAG